MLGHSSTPNTVRSTDQDSNGDSLAFGSENDEKRGPAVRSRREPPPRLQTDSSGRLRLNEGASGRAGSGLGGFDSQASIMSTASDPTGRRAKPPFRRAGSSTHSLRSPRLGRKQSRSLGVLRALQASGMAERSYAPIHTGSSRRTLGTAAVVVPASSPTRQLLLQKHADRLEGLQKSFRSHSSSDSVRQKVSLRMQRKAQEYNYNFEVHGKRLQLSPRAWYMFGEDSRARQMAVWLTYHPRFDSVILALIILNSVVLAITDYSLDAIDSNMEPDADRSWRNAVPVYAQPVFTALFCLEFVLKALAMGFCFDAGSYLRDSWNVLDFLVVVTSVLNFIPGVPEITALRVFRVLRPLRTIELLPGTPLFSVVDSVMSAFSPSTVPLCWVAGLKLLVSALLKSLPQLATVVMFLTFIFSLFGVLGVQIWSGSLHSRCRLTEFPVQIPSTEVDTFFMRSTQYFDPVHADHAAAVTYIDRVLTDRSLYPWCGADVSGTPLPLDSDTWTFSSSPWQQSRDCVWPIDESDTKLCTQGSFGSHTCATDRWCGSNYDAYGNERFSSDRVMRSATFLPEFLFGYAGFDWIFPAFLTIFECITLESWADIMYMVRTGVHCHAHVSLRVVGWLMHMWCALPGARQLRCTGGQPLLHHSNPVRIVPDPQPHTRCDLGTSQSHAGVFSAWGSVCAACVGAEAHFILSWCGVARAMWKPQNGTKRLCNVQGKSTCGDCFDKHGVAATPTHPASHPTGLMARPHKPTPHATDLKLAPQPVGQRTCLRPG